jgi:molecular chaperone DnaK
MNEFKDQLDATEKDKVTKLVAELREIAVKGQAGDASITADAIREKINETQQASLGLFQKVRLCISRWPMFVPLQTFTTGLREEAS